MIDSRAGIALAAAALALSCTDYEPASDTLSAEQFVPPAELADEAWGCLASADRSTPRPVAAEGADRVVYSIQVVDLSTGQIYPDASVRACGIADVNCDDPVTAALPVDDDGWVDIPLFRDFTGFLEVESADMVPFLFYLTEPVEGPTVEYPLAVISLASLEPLVQLLGVPLQANTGVVAARAFDCEGNTATGVSLSTRANATPWYFIDGLPTTQGSGSGPDGLAGLVNVNPGVTVIDLKAPNGMSIGGPQSVVIRPNWLSALFVRPPGRVRATAR